METHPVPKPINKKENRRKKTLRGAGMLSDYSDPEFRKLEKDAWEKAAERKYGSH